MSGAAGLGYGAVSRACPGGGQSLRGARVRANALLEALASLPSVGTAAEHVRALDGLVREHFEWDPASTLGRRAQRAFDALVQRCGAIRLDRAEFARLFERTVAEHATPTFAPDLAAGGGGVRVSSAMEARGSAFDVLYLIGLERGAFPRTGGEDPLFPDAMRVPLTAVLPELPVKARRRDEERFLFAALCEAAPVVHLGFSEVDDEGTTLLPSPLLSRLAGSLDEDAWAVAPPVRPTRLEDAFPDGAVPPRDASETAVVAALFREVLELGTATRARALALRDTGVPEADRAALARHRSAVLDEFDGRGPSGERLGPWLGLVGTNGVGDDWPDPFRVPQPVTAFERFARCGWQLFLERVLRLEPLPDPLSTLPTIDARHVGNTVHRALEDIVGGGSEGAVLGEDLLDATGWVPRWPTEPEDWLRIAERAARAELLEEGLPLPGLVRALARRSVPFLEAARERLDGRDAGARNRVALAVEAQADLRVQLDEDEALELTFRVDRLDRVRGAEDDDATLQLVDYKTGAPWFDSKTAGTRARKTLESIAAGTHLQGIAYARSVAPRAAVGRYVFLRDGVEEHATSIDVDSRADAFEEWSDALDLALGRIATAWRSGVFLPRLIQPERGGRIQSNPACAWCQVAEACLRGDSSANARLARWEAADEHDEIGVERIARDAWSMGKRDG